MRPIRERRLARVRRTAPRTTRALALVIVAMAGAHRFAWAQDPAARDGGPQAADAGDAPAVMVPAPPDPEAPTVTARLDRSEAHVGDALTLTITAVGRVPVNLPTTSQLGVFSILDRKEDDKDLGNGRRQRTFVLSIAAYQPGTLTVPSVPVTYINRTGDVRTLPTDALPLRIASLIANEPEPALKENAPPVTVWQADWLLIYIGGGLAAAAFGALITWLIVRRWRRRVIFRPGPPPRPAHEVALEKLDRLGTYGFFEDADNRPFYFAVSEIIREYLGARYGFDSLELTTDELLDELRRNAGRELIMVEVQGWLTSCDLVKFAKISPSVAEARGTLEEAIRIVGATRPRPEPQATVADAQAVGHGMGNSAAPNGEPSGKKQGGGDRPAGGTSS